MARVILVQEPLKMEGGVTVPRINYATLRPYGTVEFLFSWGELKDDDALEDTDRIVRRLREILHNFSDRDYIVPLGNPALIGMAIAVAADCNDGRVAVLDWIRDQRRYRIVHVDIDCADTPEK